MPVTDAPVDVVESVGSEVLPGVVAADVVVVVPDDWLLAVCSASSRLFRSSASLETPDAAEGVSRGGGGGGGGAVPVGGVPDAGGVVPEVATRVDGGVPLDEVAAS
jgi:hypothetical protein